MKVEWLQWIVIALFILQCRTLEDSTLLCELPDTELFGSTTIICPGSSGIFECKTTNTEVLIWFVNDITIPIDGDMRLQGGQVEDSGNIASLVKLNLTNGNIGNRTSILRVKPSNDVTISIGCSGEGDICRRDIKFLGSNSIIDIPTPQGMDDEKDGTFNFSWTHDLKEMVSRYFIVLGTEENEVFNFTSFNTSIIIPQTQSKLHSANLTAVSVCGGESEPASFQVVESGSGSTTIRSVPVIILASLMILSYV